MDDEWLNSVVDDWELYVLVPSFSEIPIKSFLQKKHIKLYRYFTVWQILCQNFLKQRHANEFNSW